MLAKYLLLFKMYCIYTECVRIFKLQSQHYKIMLRYTTEFTFLITFGKYHTHYALKVVLEYRDQRHCLRETQLVNYKSRYHNIEVYLL